MAKAPGYPLGILAPYGPDADRATKLVLTIERRPGDRGAMYEWTAMEGDVRLDDTVSAELDASRILDAIEACLADPHGVSDAQAIPASARRRQERLQQLRGVLRAHTGEVVHLMPARDP